MKNTDYPMHIQVKLMLTEVARHRILKTHYVRIRNAIRRDPSISIEEVKALMAAAYRAYEEDFQRRTDPGTER